MISTVFSHKVILFFLISLVNPEKSSTKAMFFFTIKLNNEDFPTFGFPRIIILFSILT